ncbi:MAG: PKD domain-containing protein, partial [Ignavibacteriales bacterium]|nr:PKD domain-containing protein [Ignavibacteriales bacterium]
ILAFIDKEEYAASIEMQRNEIISQYRIARAKEKQDGLTSAIHQYYEIFLAGYFYPGTIEAEGRDGIIYPDLKTYMLGILKEYFDNISVQCERVAIEPYSGEMITITLRLEYDKQQAQNIEIKLENTGSTFREVQNGNADLITDFLPSFKNENLSLVLRPILNETNEYYQFHKATGPIFKRTIPIDFSALIRINFKAENLPGNALKFEPMIENLNVKQIKWDFGDNSYSMEITPIHKYKKNGVYEVKLNVNADPGLITSKFLDQTGNEADEVPSEIIINSIRREPDFVPPVPKALQELMEKQTVQDLSGIKDSKDVIGYLEVMRSQGKITYGKKSDFIKPELCYLLVYDNELKSITNFLTPMNEGRYDIFSGELIKDVSQKFKGKTGIWLIINY